MAAETFVVRDIGADLDFVVSTARSTGEERSGSTGVYVIPARLDARKDEQLILVRGERLHDGGKFECGTDAFRRPIFHGHSVRNVEGLESMRPRRGCAERRE